MFAYNSFPIHYSPGWRIWDKSTLSKFHQENSFYGSFIYSFSPFLLFWVNNDVFCLQLNFHCLEFWLLPVIPFLQIIKYPSGVNAASAFFGNVFHFAVQILTRKFIQLRWRFLSPTQLSEYSWDQFAFQSYFRSSSWWSGWDYIILPKFNWVGFWKVPFELMQNLVYAAKDDFKIVK